MAASSRPLLLGHRGASKYAPENTLESFDLALEHGCDGFEFDVRYTCDRHTVLCHDPFLNGLEVAQTSYMELCYSVPARELAELRSSHAVSGAVSSAAMLSADPKLASLQNVILSYSESAFLDIELKVPGEISTWLPLLTANAPKLGYVVSSFLPEVLLAVHEQDSSIPLGLIVGSREGEELSRWHSLPVSTLILNTRLIVPAVIKELHEAKKKIYVWTVNDRDEMLEMAAMGIDGIISDDTRLLSATFLKQ